MTTEAPIPLIKVISYQIQKSLTAAHTARTQLSFQLEISFQKPVLLVQLATGSPSTLTERLSFWFGTCMTGIQFCFGWDFVPLGWSFSSTLCSVRIPFSPGSFEIQQIQTIWFSGSQCNVLCMANQLHLPRNCSYFDVEYSTRWVCSSRWSFTTFVSRLPWGECRQSLVRPTNYWKTFWLSWRQLHSTCCVCTYRHLRQSPNGDLCRDSSNALIALMIRMVPSLAFSHTLSAF